jgi:hypothetical protein
VDDRFNHIDKHGPRWTFRSLAGGKIAAVVIRKKPVEFDAQNMHITYLLNATLISAMDGTLLQRDADNRTGHRKP